MKKGQKYEHLQRAEKKICPVCQKIFFARETRKKYCSHKCYSVALSEKLKNENSWFWKGGKTKEITKKRTSAKYKEWRLKVFSRDGFICQQCGSKKKLEAHHIKEVCNYPALIYDINNGITLCRDCHKKTDNYGTKATQKGAEKK